MGYQIGVVCTQGVGPERGGRERNEDNYLVCHKGQVRYLEHNTERVADAIGEGTILAVCDGMGGHENGQVASLTASKVMAKLYRPGTPPDPERALWQFVQNSHRQLHESALEAGPVTMGTTLVVCWLLHGTVSWVNVGDSRLYLYRHDTLELLTLDQTRNEFARRDEGVMIHDDHLVQNFIYGSRGLGNNTTLRLELGLDTGSLPLSPGDVLVLCSDGLTGVADIGVMEAILHAHPNPQDAAEALTLHAIQSGATDNVTALVASVVNATPPKIHWTDDFKSFSSPD
ncbi:MAG: SpoIIE family protein phosphatase [Rhodobacterales bacterium]|nr:SpoIIE family protein phosphatase [Rhodobacterales bacterium]